MGLTTDPNNPCLKESRPDGQQECYLVLSEEERAKGYVRPVRTSYKHVGKRPQYPLRDLTDEEKVRYAAYGYAYFESYPEDQRPKTGRFWTIDKLNSGCQSITHMGQALSETYARNPKFYGATFCCTCGKHIPVEEFVWIEPDGTVSKSRLGE